MAKYFIKSPLSGQIDGPLSGTDVRNLVATGEVTPETLISMDQVAWHPATRVKGLFDPVSPEAPQPMATATARPIVGVAMPPAPPPPMPHAASPMPTPPPPPPPPASVSYFIPGSESTGSIRPRSVTGIWIIAGIALAMYAFVFVKMYQVQTSRWVGDTEVMTLLGSLCGFLLLLIPATVLWLIWVHGTHKDLRGLAGGNQLPSPAQAVGFSLIPVFDGFWIIYMPWRLCKAVNNHLQSAGQAQVPSWAIITCQSCSVVTALLFPGLTPVFYATSMTMIQRGLNRVRMSAFQ